MTEFILINGKFHNSDEKLFTLVGTGTFLFEEKIRSIRNHLVCYPELIELLSLKFRLLNQLLPDYLQNNGAGLKRQIERFLSRNKLFKSAVVSLKFFQDQSGVTYIISAVPIGSFQYDLNKNGLQVDIFDGIKKPISELSALSFGSKIFWEIATRNLENSEADEFLIQNTEGKIVEAPEKNIYLIQGNDLLYPGISAASFIDISLSMMLNLAKQNGLNSIEVEGFKQEELMCADELFLVSSIVGVQWILGFRGKRYYNIKSKMMLDSLNRQFS